MSRTYKDRPSKVRFPREDNWVFTEGYGIRYLPTIEPKKPKELDTENHWMSTPSYWTRIMMNRPERRAAHLLERKALFSDTDEFDFPDLGYKPHQYYW